MSGSSAWPSAPRLIVVLEQEHGDRAQLAELVASIPGAGRIPESEQAHGWKGLRDPIIAGVVVEAVGFASTRILEWMKTHNCRLMVRRRNKTSGKTIGPDSSEEEVAKAIEEEGELEGPA
jgi:hypothetical protein